jgi:hypothetical protein
MAASSSPVFSSQQLGFLPVSEKLTRSNYAMWSRQVLSAIRGAQLSEFIESTAKPPERWLTSVKGDGTIDEKKSPEPNPKYATWVAKDQTVLNFLLTSLSKEIFLR